MTQTILIIDDEADIRDLLGDIFEDEEYNIMKSAHSEQALSVIENNEIDLIVLDIWLENSDMDGVEILKHLKKSKFANIPILMISGHGNVEMAVNTMKLGAFDFIEKPFKIDHILLTVNRALEQKTLKDENYRLKEKSEDLSLFHNYKSPKMLDLIKTIENNAGSDARVMITGESGTGKSYIAKLIHSFSKKQHDKMKHIHATNLNEPHALRELFLSTDDIVVIEQVEKLSQKSQTELLTLINDPNITINLITTCDTTFEKDKFSSALYDRLSVIKYNVPSLSNRAEDIPVLIEEFYNKISLDLDILKPVFSKEAIMLLQQYQWTQNIRQLKSAIEWAILKTSAVSTNKNIPIHIAVENLIFLQSDEQSDIININQNYASNSTSSSPIPNELIADILNMSLKDAREVFERYYLTEMLDKFYGNISNVSQHVDMERTALHRKLKTLGINYKNNNIKVG